MQAGTVYTEHPNKVAGLMYRSICTENKFKPIKSKWEIPPNVEENDRAKIL